MNAVGKFRLMYIAITPLAILTSCSKAMDIEVDFEGKEPTFSFFLHKPLWSRHEISPCIWNFRISDYQTGRSVVTRVSGDQCVKVRRINLSKMMPGLSGQGDASSLTPGRRYRATVSAEEAIGRSEWWVAP